MGQDGGEVSFGEAYGHYRATGGCKVLLPPERKNTNFPLPCLQGQRGRRVTGKKQD